MTTGIPLVQVDAFSAHPFAGNPAAVCPLDGWLPDATMQAVAAENNLSETAFLVPADEPDTWHLRWFTPGAEVDLCGHATLASAHVLFERSKTLRVARFLTRSGLLKVEREGAGLALDLPAAPPAPVAASPQLVDAVGGSPQQHLVSSLYRVLVYDTEREVAALSPDFRALGRIEGNEVIATAPGDPGRGAYDFVSRFFAPGLGVDEDPVTGSAHCVLTPYWGERLGRTELRARQISARGGDVGCELRGDRVRLIGDAVTVLEGTFLLPD
ncbi:MAG: PhzF family phenazine biosynthesis protein [Planctomycetota bacterium]